MAKAIPAVTPREHRLEPAKLGLLLFIVMEVMFFAGLISAFIMFRFSPIPWPPAGQPRLPVLVTGLNTLLLLFSGFSFYRALKDLRADKYTAFLSGLEVTTWLGFLFLFVQGAEWVRLLNFGLTLSSGIFGGFFYSLVGLHALHAAGGLLALFWVRRRAYRAAYVRGKILGVELCQMYWFFVVGLWPVLFVLVYL
jgi:heme/copper-type cytochrome/quinol oxidase subunit 3